MKSKIIGLLVCTLMISSILAGAASINTNSLNEEIFNSISQDDVISITINIDSYDIVKTENGDEISAEGFGRLLIPGKPDLPSKIFSIAIPPGTEFVDISYETEGDVFLSGVYNVPPCKLPRVIGLEDPEIYEKELAKYEENYNSVYGSNDPYPESVVEFERTAGFRKYNLVDVQVAPFTYYPLDQKLLYHPIINIKVSYVYPEGYSEDDIMVDDILQAEQKAEKIVYNYNEAKNWYPTGPVGRETYDYVIITLDSLTDDVDSLVDWEEAKGRSVNVVTTSWINSNYNGYDLEEKMRNFLREKYPEGEWGILEVCLIGSYDDVPMRLTAQNVGYGRPETDYYYAELSLPDSQSWDADGDHQYGENSDPIDFTAEVNVGRIPWNDATTVEHICDKSVAYEQNDDDSFKKNILLLGAFFWYDTDNAVLMEYKTDDSIHPWMSDWTMTKMYEQGQSSYPMDYNLEYDNVKNVWSTETFAFVDWAGHGSPTACYEYYPSQAFVDTDTCNYLNDDYPAIVFADACSNSDTDYLNIGQAMLKQGAIGFLGSTKVAYGMPAWNDPYDGSSQSLDYWFTTCCTSGDYTQGQAHQYALYEMYTNNLWYYPRFEMFEWGSLWGNPDLGMAPITTSNPPNTPDAPDGPDEWVADLEAEFSAVGIDPDGDQIYYMFDWGDGEFSDWVGPYTSGQRGYAQHTWTELGEYDVKVKVQDEYGAKSDWSDAHPLSIIVNTPPDAPSINGPRVGRAGQTYDYKFIGTDPNNHDVYLYVDWDDGTNENYIGPYSSGEEVTLSHTWNSSGSYQIKARLMDICGEKGDWAYLDVTLPLNQLNSQTLNQIFETLMMRFNI